jgi:glutathione gamma-glutamylcysteinyltransferase
VKDAEDVLRSEEAHKCLAMNSLCSRPLPPRSIAVHGSAPSPEIPAPTTARGDSHSEGHVSFHGRALPGHLISLESTEGQQLFAEAFQRGHATNFFPLITNFASQSDVSMCGPASLAMVLNALRLDPRRTWRSPWRWWSDEMFACCEGSLRSMKSLGVTLQLFDRIARSQEGLLVSTQYPQSLSAFQEALAKCATEPATHVIVSFSREALGQTGIGHFSPVAAVHRERGLALILDVARFKYPPYWVRTESLYEAMRVVDPSTNMSRGYCVLSRHAPDT